MSLNDADQYAAPTVTVKHDGSISDIVTSNRQHYGSTSRQQSAEQVDTSSTAHSRKLLHDRHTHHHTHVHHSDEATDTITQGGDADAKAIDAGGGYIHIQ